MKKLYLVVLCLMALPLIAIQVSGVQSGTWTADNNPYEVTGDITVPLTDTLILDAGVEVEFTGVFRITVEGLIEVNGTETDSVLIGPSETLTDLWESIRLEREGAGFFNTFEHCIISGAEAAVHSINSPVQVYNSRFTDCETAIDLFAIGATNPAEVHISDNIIENSIMSGIELTENSNVLIEHNTIRYNGSGTQYRGAIQIGIQSTGVNCSPTISENTIINNHKQGIICTDMFSAGIIDAQIIDNDIRQNLTGIYFYNCEGTVVGNNIEDNFITGNANSGAGIMCYGSRAIPYISQNIIAGNFTAIYITASGNPNLGNLADASIPIQGLNHFGDNIDMSGNNNSVYVDQNGTAPVMAQNNFWISENPVEIGVTIHDGNDSAGMPMVVFDPIATEDVMQLFVTITSDIPNDEIASLQLHFKAPNPTNSSYAFYADSLSTIAVSGVEYGSYQIYCIAWGIDGQEIGVGNYGTQYVPTLFEINDQTVDQTVELEINSEYYESAMYVGELTNIFSVPSHKYINISQGYPYHNYSYVYYANDYLRKAGVTQIDTTSNSLIDIEFDFPENKMLKVNNLSIGDTWQSIYRYDPTSGPTYRSSEIISSQTIEYAGLERLAYVVQNTGDLVSYYFLVEDIGIVKSIVYSNDYVLAGHDLSYSDITPDGTFFPLSEGNLWSQVSFESLDTPWLLRLDNQARIRWEAPSTSEMSFDGYRIYADGSLFDEVDFSTRIYDFPIPVNRPDVEISVTAFSSTFESDPSNVLTLDIQGENENTQNPIPVASLNSNYPNPFNPETNISFSVTNDNVNTSIDIYNIRGEKVNTIVDAPLAVGTHTVVWNGTDNNGKSVSSGVYFMKMKSGKFTSSRKLILMK